MAAMIHLRELSYLCRCKGPSGAGGKLGPHAGARGKLWVPVVPSYIHSDVRELPCGYFKVKNVRYRDCIEA